MLADLHLHSTCSDGTLTPARLARTCAERGLQVISVTDHDTWRQNELLAAEPSLPPIRWIPGIELSTSHEPTSLGLHILGYGLVPDGPFREMIERLATARQTRVRSLARALERIGIRIDDDAILGRATSPGKPDVARSALADPGNAERLDADHVSDVGGFIETYMNPGCVAHVPKWKIPTADAVASIRRCGGHPVWAHPALDLREIADPGDRSAALGRTLDELIEAGLEGIETVNFCHRPDETRWLGEVARRRGLRQTAGSDFHDFEDKDTYRILTGRDQDVSWLMEP